MATLNQLGSKISNILGKPGDHNIQERAKSACKALFATFIRQSIERNGIDEAFKVSFNVHLVKVPLTDIENTYAGIGNRDMVFTTEHKVPTPVRITNDAPFLHVYTQHADGSFINYKYANNSMAPLLTSIYSPTGVWGAYQIVNGKLKIIIKNTLKDFVIDECDYKYLTLVYIAENPEEVISMYSEDDGQDVELPLPADMIERVVYEVLRVNFGIKPTEHEVKIISDSTYAPNDPEGTQRLIHNKVE
ncbi:MAG: hypothetical protein HDQ88_04680 [Clostridia bacterium]|nr:hypothetical protein [Clostridia bacterium]